MTAARTRMIDEQLVRRKITDARVLDAFRSVPREAFVPERLAELAYEDGPLPIGEGQTISQPYVVALTLEALDLRGGERVLEIGTGSGYAAALLGRIAAEVHTVERLPTLGAEAAGRLAALGYANVHVTIADGSVGLPEHAPYDAIAVAAAGPTIPGALREQLAIGGRLVMPVAHDGGQALVRVTRRSAGEFTEEHLLDVTFVPLIGAQAWPVGRSEDKKKANGAIDPMPVLRRYAEPLDLARVVDRIGDARVVLLGGAIDGSLELVRLRVRLTRELLARGRFAFVAVEGDWNDGARVDEHVRRRPERADLPLHAFARYPSLRFRNREVATFVDELRASSDVGFHGLDVYGTTSAISLALERVTERDPERAGEAAARCTTISPWRRGVADLLVEDADLETPLVRTLVASLRERVEAIRAEGSRVHEAARRAAEDGALYYRHLLHGSLDAWSIRTDAMANMLRALLEDQGPDARAVVWAHDTQVADAAGAETGVRGHRTLGQLARLGAGGGAYLVGIDAGSGSVLASPAWGKPPEPMRLRRAAEGSHERFLEETGLPALALPIRGAPPELRDALRTPRLSRAIGPVYRADRELVTHYLAVAPALAFDELLFVSESTPLEALSAPATCEPELVHPLA